MKFALPLAAVVLGTALSACAATPADAASATPAANPTAMTCSADNAKASFIGKKATPEVVEQVRQATGSKNVRVIPPDTMVTADFREDRLNLDVDANQVITGVRCG